MSLSGGLIQLISKNNEDIILSEEPEIFPFLKIYKKYTNFSIDEIDKNLGSFKKDNEFNIKLNNTGDLLGNMHFVIKIPKKYEEDVIKNITKNTKTKNFLSFKMFNTTYYVTTSKNNITEDIIGEVLLLTDKNFNINSNLTRDLKKFQITLEGENNIILNTLLSYDNVKILEYRDVIINEITKFNNIREKFFLGYANKSVNKDKNISVLSDYFNNSYNRLYSLFVEGYDFTFNKNLSNELFNLDNNIIINYITTNTNIENLEYLGFVILDNIMSHLKYNNQRFYIEYNYEYNNESDIFNFSDNNILNVKEWSNNQDINLDEILNKEFSIDMLQNFVNSYYETESFIETNYNNINSSNKLLLINLLNYRDILKNNFEKNDDDELSLDIELQTNFTTNYIDNYFKRGILNIKVNLIYRLLEKFDSFFNSLSKISDNLNPLLLFKRIIFCYVYLRDHALENGNFRDINNFKNIIFDVDSIEIEGELNSYFFIGIDRMYPLKKDFFKNEVNKLKYVKNYQIHHPKILDNTIIQQVVKKVTVSTSDKKKFQYMINGQQLEFKFISKYSFTLNNKTLISYVENNNIYFNIDLDLDYSLEYDLNIISKTEFFDINNIISHDYNSTDGYTSLPENIIKDINICRKFNIKDYMTNCFINNNTFSFIYKRHQYDSNTDSLDETFINIFDYFDVILNTISYNYEESNSKITNDMVTVDDNTYIVNDFNHLKYRKINLVLVMKPKIVINIDSTANKTLNTTYDDSIIPYTFISKNVLIEKYVNYLLLYYNFNEIEMMKDSYETIEDDFTNVHYDISEPDGYLATLIEYIEYKYLAIDRIKLQNISGGFNFLQETHDVIEIYYVIPTLLNIVEITNSYYYDNLLKLTSLSTVISNSYYTDFLTYHPMIIRIDDNNSIILNTTDFDLFEISKIDDKNIIVNETIDSRDLFKEFNFIDNSINSISTILPEDLDIVSFFDNIYQDEIVEMININEVNMDIIYLENLNKIIKGTFGEYPKKVLNYLLENNINNDLFNFNSNQFKTSIYKFYQDDTEGEVSEIINNFTLMELIRDNMTTDFFNNRKINSNDFLNLKKLGEYFKEKYTYVSQNITSLYSLDSNNYVNEIILQKDGNNKLKDFIINNDNSVNQYLHPLLFDEKYIKKITNSDIYQSYAEDKQEFLKDFPNIFCYIIEGKIADFDDNLFYTLSDNIEVLDENNFLIKEGNVLNPKFVEKSEITENLLNYNGYLYQVKINDFGDDILNNYCILHNGEEYYYVYVFKIENDIITLLSSELFNMFKMILLYPIETGSFDELDLDWSYEMNDDADFTKYIVELEQIYQYKNIHESTNYTNVLDALLLELDDDKYYFCKNENPSTYQVIREDLYNLVLKDRVFSSPKITLQDDIIYKIHGRDIYFIEEIPAFDETGELLEGNFILEPLDYIQLELQIYDGTTIFEQTGLNFVDDILVIVDGKFIRLNSEYLLPAYLVNTLILAIKIVSREKTEVFNYTYELTDVVNNVENNFIKINENYYNCFENGLIQQRDYVTLFNKYITRTIHIKDSYEYSSFVNDNPTNIINFSSLEDTVTITIKNTDDNLISFRKNFILDSKFIKYTLNSLTSTDDSDYDELEMQLDSNYDFKVNKEYTFILTINEEKLLFSIYYNTNDLIYLNLDDGDLTNVTDINDENINRPLEFNNIITNYSNLDDENIYIFNFPLIKDIVTVTDNFIIEPITPTDYILLEKPLKKIINGVFMSNPGYIFYENNQLFMYTKSNLIEGMEIMINQEKILITKTFGKISKIETNMNVEINILIFDGYIYNGLEYTYFNDDELNNFKVNYSGIIRPVFNYIKPIFDIDLFTHVSNGFHDSTHTLIYYVVQNLNYGFGVGVIETEKPITNVNRETSYGIFTTRVLMLNINREFIGATMIYEFVQPSRNFYVYEGYNPDLKYIVVNGDYIRYKRLKINNEVINNETNNLEIKEYASVTVGIYNQLNKNFKINRYTINDNEENFIINNDILIKILNNLDAEFIFILNDRNKINLIVDEDSLKENLLFLYTINSYLFDEINSDETLDDYIINTTKTDLLLDMKKILDNINLNQLTIKLKLELTYLESNLNFVKEFYDNKSLIHLIKLNNNVITSSLKIEDNDNILLLNGIYKIKIKNDMIIYQKNKFELVKYNNMGIFNNITFQIPIEIVTSIIDNNGYKYIIKINNDVFNPELIEPLILDNIIFLDEELTFNISNSIKIDDIEEEEGFSFYVLNLDNNFQFSNLYIQVTNQIINKEKESSENFILENLDNDIYYTNRIDNIERIQNNSYQLDIKYKDSLDSNMDKKLILLSNSTESIVENESIIVKTDQDIDNLPLDNKNNIFYKSNNKEIVNFDTNSFDPFFLYYRNIVNINELYQDFSNVELQAALNSPISDNFIILNETRFTKEQYDRIKDIDKTEYSVFYSGAISVVNFLLDNYYANILVNFTKGINNMDDLDFKIQYHLNKKFPFIPFIYDRNIGLNVEGHQDYNDVHLSIRLNEENEFFQENFQINNNKHKLFTFKEFISKIESFLNLAISSRNEIFDYVKNNKIENFNFLDILKKFQYSKYCINRNYNPDYIENNNNKIFKYKLEINIIEDSYELFINKINIPYDFFDDKNIIFYYSEPEIVVTSLELKKRYIINNTNIIGKGYKLNVNVILGDGSEDELILEEGMKLITKLDSNILELKVFDNNTVFTNINLASVDNFNLFQDIYIYNIIEDDLNLNYYFNIEEIYLNVNNIYLLIDMINYNVEVNFEEKIIIIPKTEQNLINKLQLNQYYYMTNLMYIDEFETTDDILKIIETNEDLNIENDETFFLDDDIEIKNIKKINPKQFEIISVNSNPEVLIRDKVEKINDSIVYDSFEFLDDKVYLINTVNDYININSNVIADGVSYNIFKIDNNFVFKANFDEANMEDIFILNRFTLNLNENDGYYYSNESYLDFVNDNSDYNLSYYFFNNDEKIDLTIDDMIGNKFKLDENLENEIEVFQKIEFQIDTVFQLYKYDNILVLNFSDSTVNTNLIEGLKGVTHIDDNNNIFEIPVPLDKLENAKISVNIDNIITDAIMIETNENNFFIKFDSIVEIDSKCYFISNENLEESFISQKSLGYDNFNIVPIFKVNIKDSFIINSITENSVTLFTDSNIILPTINYFFITKSYLNITNITYGETSFDYQDITIIENEEKKITEIIPNKFEIFSYLKLFIDNNMIDKLDPDIYKTIYHYHFSNEKKKQFDEMTKLRDKGDFYQMTFPIMFYFYDTPHIFLPLVALTNSEIKLFGKVNFDCKLELMNQFILLDDFERYKFGSYGHEYLIEKYHNYSHFYLDKEINISKLHINGIIKNMYFKTVDKMGNNVEIIKETIYDDIYKRYLDEKSKFTTIYKRIIDEIELYFNDDNNNLFVMIKKIYQIFKTKTSIKDIISYEFILYVLYQGTSYLSYLNNLDYYLLRTIIILNTLKIKENVFERPYLNTLNFKCNGDSLFNKHDELYFNSVTPYKKLNSDLPNGYYFMTFSLQPEEKNPSGHLNFNLFEENVLITSCNENIFEKNVQVSVITKEYNILRIIGGMGSLTWSKI